MLHMPIDSCNATRLWIRSCSKRQDVPSKGKTGPGLGEGKIISVQNGLIARVSESEIPLFFFARGPSSDFGAKHGITDTFWESGPEFMDRLMRHTH